MATNNSINMEPGGCGGGSNTTFVQADPSTFRAVVQRLTGPEGGSDAEKPPVSAAPARHSSGSKFPSAAAGEMGPRRSAFKLHERRQGGAMRSLCIELGAGGGFGFPAPGHGRNRGSIAFPGERTSPVSPLDLFSPKTPSFEEKGFYCLHPTARSTPRPSHQVPELLPLFPLTPPGDSTSPSSS